MVQKAQNLKADKPRFFTITDGGICKMWVITALGGHGDAKS